MHYLFPPISTMIWAERKVELAFEGQRFFDIRRWKIVPKVMGKLNSMDVSKNDDSFYKVVPAITPHIFLPTQRPCFSRKPGMISLKICKMHCLPA